MITLNKIGETTIKSSCEFYGLSTDEKPCHSYNGTTILNASTFYEMDTKKLYIYDEENHIWYEI